MVSKWSAGSRPIIYRPSTEHFFHGAACSIFPVLSTHFSYFAISFRFLLATTEAIMCSSWFMTLQACNTRALQFLAKMADTRAAFAFSSSIFLFSFIHFLMAPVDTNDTTLTLKNPSQHATQGDHP